MKLLALVGLSLVIAGCSGAPESTEPAASAPAASPAGSTTPRVFFVEPTDGATVKSPVMLKFGAENFMVMAVPAGEVMEVRAGMGHHHVGVDIDCLPPGTEIPKANPWVHFGTGSSEMAPGVQLTPGPHKLTLQIGDDKHMTMPGLCQTINVTVVE